MVTEDLCATKHPVQIDSGVFSNPALALLNFYPISLA